jgi:hypothetical protein
MSGRDYETVSQRYLPDLLVSLLLDRAERV